MRKFFGTIIFLSDAWFLESKVNIQDSCREFHGKLLNFSRVLFFNSVRLSGKDTGSTNCLDFFFSDSGEESSLDNDRLLWQYSLAENFEVTSAADVDNRGLLRISFILDTGLLRH